MNLNKSLNIIREVFPEMVVVNMKKIFIVNNNEEMKDLAERMCSADINKPLKIEVCKYKKNRSLAQSRLFHMHMREISKFYGETSGDYHAPSVWKQYFKDLFLGDDTFNIKGTKVTETRHTANLKADEMSEFIEKVIMAAGEEFNCFLTLPKVLYNESKGVK